MGNNVELSVSTEVLEKMASIATLEVEGVAALSKKSIDLKRVIKTKSAFKGIKVENINGAIVMTVYVTLKKEAKLRETAEAIQKNVKEKLQNMTGAAVTKVNVVVDDIFFESATQTEDE